MVEAFRGPRKFQTWQIGDALVDAIATVTRKDPEKPAGLDTCAYCYAHGRVFDAMGKIRTVSNTFPSGSQSEEGITARQAGRIIKQFQMEVEKGTDLGTRLGMVGLTPDIAPQVTRRAKRYLFYP